MTVFRGVDPTDPVLERARELSSNGEFLALAELLEPLSAEELVAEPELGFLLARTWKLLGRGQDALGLVRFVLPESERRGNGRLARLCRNLEATLLFDLGETVQAREAWLAVLELSSRADDAEMVAFVNNNLGVLHTLHDEPEDALAAYGRAVAAYQRLGILRGLAQSNHNLAITYRELGFLDRADARFRRAADYAREAGSEEELARVDQERALLVLFRADSTLARTMARRALQRFERLGDPTGAGEAWRVLGLASLAEGATDEAREHLQHALELAQESGAALLEAETSAALAIVEERAGNAERAETLLTRADRLFAGLGAGFWGEKAREQAQAIAAGLPPVPTRKEGPAPG